MTDLSAWLANNGSLIFLGMPFVAYLMQAFFVYRPAGRIGLIMMMMGYAWALIGQYLDTKGI